MRKLALLAVAVAMVGCGKLEHLLVGATGHQVVGSGKVTSVNHPVGAFKAIRLEGSIDADITIGSPTNVKISGDDNVVQLVRTEVTGDTLRIYTEKSYSTHNPLKATITVPELTAASVNGSGAINLRNYRGDSLALAINGSGSVDATGTVGKLDATISGSGDLRLAGLHARDAAVNIGGSGNADVNVSGDLEGSIAGSGDIVYSGNPKVQKSIAGSGSIKPH